MAATSCGLHDEDFDDDGEAQEQQHLDPPAATTAPSQQPQHCGSNAEAGACQRDNNGGGRGCAGGQQPGAAGGGCHRHDDKGSASVQLQQQQQQRPQGSWARAAVTLGDGTLGTSSAGAAGARPVCSKCKAVPAVVNVRHGEATCQACLDVSVIAKVRTAKSRGLLLHQDKVLVAVSGGCSSLALLACLVELQGTPGRVEKGKLPMELLPVHVQEGPAWGCGAEALALHEGLLREAVAATGCRAQLLVVPLSSLMQPGGDAWAVEAGAGGAAPSSVMQQGVDASSAAMAVEAGAGAGGAAPSGVAVRGNGPVASVEAAGAGESEAGESEAAASAATAGAYAAAEGTALTADVAAEEALVRLVQSVRDVTGREDLVAHLRDQALHEVAGRLGFTKVARGDTANTLAIHVIADTAKGRGHSLPANIAAIDARHGPGGPATVRLLRDLTSKEAVWFCRGRGVPGPVTLPVLPPPNEQSHQSVNQLAEAFVCGIQATLPFVAFTIVKTASALRPFDFNSPDVANAASGSTAAADALMQAQRSQQQQRRQQLALQQQEQQQGGEQGGADDGEGFHNAAVEAEQRQQQQEQHAQEQKQQQRKQHRGTNGKQRDGEQAPLAEPQHQHRGEHGAAAAAQPLASVGDEGGGGGGAPCVLCVLCQAPMSREDMRVGGEVLAGLQAGRQPLLREGQVAAGTEEQRGAGRAAAGEEEAVLLQAGCCRSCRTQLVGSGLSGYVAQATAASTATAAHLPGYVAKRLVALRVAQDW